MWMIVSLILAIGLIISIGVQHDQKKEIESLKEINKMIRDALRNR